MCDQREHDYGSAGLGERATRCRVHIIQKFFKKSLFLDAAFKRHQDGALLRRNSEGDTINIVER
jgi:hypothetical protein